MEGEIILEKSWKNDLIPVQFQGQVTETDTGNNSCWAFGVATLLSYEIHNLQPQERHFLASVQHLIDHCSGEGSEICSKGRIETRSVLQYVKDHGLSLKYFYENEEPPIKNPNTKIPKGPKIKISGYHSLKRNDGGILFPAIRDILQDHVVLASIELYESFGRNQFRPNEVYMQHSGEKKDGSHCVVITGYGTHNGVNFYEIHNCWGTTWGNQGFGLINWELVRPFAYIYYAYVSGQDRR